MKIAIFFSILFLTGSIGASEIKFENKITCKQSTECMLKAYKMKDISRAGEYIEYNLRALEMLDKKHQRKNNHIDSVAALFKLYDAIQSQAMWMENANPYLQQHIALKTGNEELLGATLLYMKDNIDATTLELMPLGYNPVENNEDFFINLNKNSNRFKILELYKNKRLYIDELRRYFKENAVIVHD